MHPARHRGAQRLRACTRNRSDKNGRPTEEVARPAVYMPAIWLLGSSALRKNPADFAAQILKTACQNTSPRIEDYRPVKRKLVILRAHRLPHAPLHPVALDRLPDRTGHGKPKAGWHACHFISQTESGEATTRHAYACLVNRAELGRFAEPLIAGKRQRYKFSRAYFAARTARSSLTVNL